MCVHPQPPRTLPAESTPVFSGTSESAQDVRFGRAEADWEKKAMIRRISIAILVAACCVLVGLLLLARRPVIAPIERPVPGSFSAGSVAQGEALAAAGH